MKKIISLLITCAISVCFIIGISSTVNAATSGTSGTSISWSYDNGILTISGSGDIADFYSNSPAPWSEFASTTTEIIINDGITSIGQLAFDNFSTVSKISMPQSLVRLDNYAFRNCVGLVDLCLPEGLLLIEEDVFSGCKKLKNVYVPESLTSIGEGSFYGCDALENVYITSLEAWCNITFARWGESNPLYYAENLYIDGVLTTKIVIPDSVNTIKGYSFPYSKMTDLVIPSSVTTIEPNAFLHCTGLNNLYLDSIDSWVNVDMNPYYLDFGSNFNVYVGDEIVKEITLSPGITEIKSSQFKYWKSLEKINLPDGITKIGNSAFQNTGLTEIVIPEGVTSIESYAFDNCRSLSLITLPSTITEIGKDAFRGCAITDLYVSDLESWIKISFENSTSNPLSGTSYQYSTKMYINNELLTTLKIPNGVTKVDKYSFSNCDSLTEVIMPNTLKNVEALAFSNCSNLSKVYYTGTEDEWNAISIGSQNTYLTNATRTYNFRYIVTYNANGGDNPPAPQNKELSKELILSTAIPTRDNYVFVGWSKEEHGEVDFHAGDIYAEDSDIVLYAVWQEKTGICGESINWEFDDVSGKLTMSGNGAMYNYATQDSTPWYRIASRIISISIGKDVSIIGENAFGACSNISEIYYSGTEEAWNNLISILNGNDIIIAAEKSYGEFSIFYDANGGENAPETQIKSKGVDFTISNAVPVKESYIFMGWSTTEDGNVEYLPDGVYDNDETLNLYAVWHETRGVCGENTNWNLDVETGIITLSGNGATNDYTTDDNAPWYEIAAFIKSVNIGKGISIGKNAFVNCTSIETVYYGGTKESFTISDGNDILTSANITYGEFNIFYNANGGENTPETQIKTAGKEINITSNIPARDTYIFLGWSTTENGDVEYLSGSSYTTDATLTLYAIWNATSGSCGENTNWCLDENTGIFTLSGNGAINDYSNDNVAPWYHISSYIKEIHIEKGITAIGSFAFETCDNLEIVKYNGTSNSFSEVNIGANNDAIKAAQKVYFLFVEILDMDGNRIGIKTHEENESIDLSDMISSNAEYYLYFDNQKFVKYDIMSPITKDLILYADIFEPVLETISISGRNSAVLGETITETFHFATNMDTNYMLCDIKYPENLKLNEIIPVAFKYVEQDSCRTEAGFTTLSLYCIYDDSGNATKGKTIIPFELSFDIDKYADLGEISIEILPTSEYGASSVANFENINNICISILPKLAEEIIISGDNAIDDIATYTATVNPDYTTNKNIEWSVSDNSVATITQDGVLKPIINGNITVYAKTLDGSNLVAEKAVSVSAKAKIDTLTTNIGDWEQAFNSDIRNYTIYVPTGVAEIDIAATYTGEGIMRINDKITRSGTARTVEITSDTMVIPIERTGVGDNYIDAGYTITIIRTKPFIKATASADGKSFNVRVYCVDDGSAVILSLYDDKKFVKLYNDVSKKGEIIPFAVTETYDEAKVMVWESLSTLKPLCEVVRFPTVVE